MSGSSQQVPGRVVVVLDVETTGTAVTDRIVEISLVWMTEVYDSPGGPPLPDFTSLVDPGVMIPEEATAIHGIATSDVIGSPSFAQIAEGVRRIIEGSDVVVGYCHDFDRGMVDEEFRRAELSPVVWPTLVDAKRLWDVYEPRVERTLTNAYKRFVDPAGFDGKHRSLHDARATASVLRAQLTEFGLMLPDGQMITPWESLDPERASWWGPTHHVVRGPSREDRGALKLNFGKHRGRRVSEVDSGFWRWLVSRDFPEHVVLLAHEAMRVASEHGMTPTRADTILLIWAERHAEKRGWT